MWEAPFYISQTAVREFAPRVGFHFFVLLTEQCSYSFCIIQKREMIWESILANSTKANYRACIWKRDKGNERENELNCGRCFCFFSSASVGACFLKQGNHTQLLPSPHVGLPLANQSLWLACHFVPLILSVVCQCLVSAYCLARCCLRAMCISHLSKWARERGSEATCPLDCASCPWRQFGNA